MSIPLSNMISRIEPHQTVLFFGAGSSLPSGAPSVEKIISKISETFGIESNSYSLSEISSIAEAKRVNSCEFFSDQINILKINRINAIYSL